MDPASIALSLVTASTQSFSSAVAISVEKSSLDSQKQIAALLASSAASASAGGALAPGVGGNLDVTA